MEVKWEETRRKKGAGKTAIRAGWNEAKENGPNTKIGSSDWFNQRHIISHHSTAAHLCYQINQSINQLLLDGKPWGILRHWDKLWWDQLRSLTPQPDEKNSQKCHYHYCTMGQNNKRSRCKNWATWPSVRSFASTAHSFACSALLTLLTRSTALTHLLTRFAHSLTCGKVND